MRPSSICDAMPASPCPRYWRTLTSGGRWSGACSSVRRTRSTSPLTWPQASAADAPDYASAIDVLGEIGVLPAGFARRFRGIAGFRNVLVHGYVAVDAARLHQLLNSGLDEFAEFARHVEAYFREG
jgi:ribonuclease HepT-like protein